MGKEKIFVVVKEVLRDETDQEKHEDFRNY